MGRTEAVISQHFYWPGIINAVQKELTNCGTCQRTKQLNNKYGTLADNLVEEIPWNKLCVDLIVPYIIIIQVQKESLNLKAVTVIDPVTVWFEITQYNYRISISIANLVETAWLSRYPRPIEIMYDQGSKFIGHEFIKSLIET